MIGVIFVNNFLFLQKIYPDMNKILRFSFIVLTMLVSVFSLGAQAPSNPVKWRVNVKMSSATEGEVIMIATIADGWHLYGMNLPKGGPKSTEINLGESTGVKFTGPLTQSVAPKAYHDAMFDMELSCWEKKVTFRRKFKVTDAAKAAIIGEIKFMSCNDVNCSAPSTEKFNKKIPQTK